MRDLVQNIAVRQSLPPAARTATVEGATVDRLGHESVTFQIAAGAWTDGTHAFSAEHSDDDSTWEAVAAADLIGSFPTVETDGASPEASDEDAQSYLVGYTGNKRYIRPKCTVTGSPSTGLVFGADVILGHPADAPTS